MPDPARDAAAVATLRQHRAQVVPVPQPGGGLKWRCLDARGRAADLLLADDPVDAIEGFAAAVAAGEAAEGTRRWQRLLAALGQGRYGLLPRATAGVGPGGGPTTILEWLVIDASTNRPVGDPFATPELALVAIANLTEAPPRQEVKGP